MEADLDSSMGEKGQAPTSSFFKVPAGEAPNGRLVRARDARRDVEYRCPGCARPLVLRRGAIRSPHFAHKCDGYCSPETALHQGVKNRIAQMLGRMLNGRRAWAPRILAPCAGPLHADGISDSWRCPREAWFSLADLAFDEVAVERATPDGLRPDVMLLHEGRPILGIEVRVSHAVDREKAVRTSMPWIELDAMHVLSSPRTWRPCQGLHPWSGRCLICTCISRLDPSSMSEITDLGDYPSQLAAAGFHEQIQGWLQSGHRRRKPMVCWRCPSCRKQNSRILVRNKILGAEMASSLRSALEPQVILHAADGGTIHVSFGFPRNANRPWAVVPLPAEAVPSLRATPDLKRLHRLPLNGTNRPLAFICPHCGADSIGVLPLPWTPMCQTDCLPK